MKILAKLLFVSFLAVNLLFVTSCKKDSSDTQENPAPLGLGDDPLPYQNTSWMARIPDTKYLCEFTIPGTHDAAADLHTSQQGTMKNFVICQDYYISNQMLLGIRWFDIRLHYSNGVLTAHHAQYYLHKNFNDLLTAGLDFLAQYPTETIIYMIKQEDSNASQDDFTQAVYNYLVGRSSDLSLFYLGHDMPALGQVRGKLVVMTREGCTSAYENKRGMYLTWDDNTKGENVDNCDYPLWVQDHYSCVTVPYSEKISEIEQGIIYANTANNNRLYINFTSCEKDLDHYLTTIAENINPPIEDYLNAHPEWNTCGVIMLNFAGGADDSKKSTTRSIVPELVQVIIDHNNFFKEVTIGTQTWMQNNLDVTMFRNGEPISNLTYDRIITTRLTLFRTTYIPADSRIWQMASEPASSLPLYHQTD